MLMMNKLIIILFFCLGLGTAQVPTRLVYPLDGSSLNTSYPVFSWISSVPSGVVFRIKIVELLSGQSPEVAILSNAIFYQAECTGQTFAYSNAGPIFRNGHTYVWQVCQFTNTESAMGLCSEPWVFSYKQTASNTETKSRPKIYPRLSTSPSGPVYTLKDELLPFSLEGQYQKQDLLYEVADSKGIIVVLKEPAPLYDYGNNYYALKLGEIRSGMYSLKVKDSKGQIYYLNFRKQNE